MKINWKRLREISQSKGISDSKLSVAIGRGKAYISLARRDDRNLNVETVLALEKVLDVSATEFEYKEDVAAKPTVVNPAEPNQFEQNVLTQLADLKEAVSMIFELVDANTVAAAKETNLEKACKLLKNMMPHNGRVPGVKYVDFISRASVLGIKDTNTLKQAIDDCNCGVMITGSATKQERWIVQMAE